MNTRDVERVAAALLYEGYLLYPYRPSAIKNRQRFTFGIVGPDGDDTCVMQTECLLRGTAATTLNVTIRFLQLSPGTGWQEVVERRVALGRVTLAEVRSAHFDWPPINGTVEVSTVPCAEGVFRACVRLTNCTPAVLSADTREDHLLHSLLSAHTIVRAAGGEFVSLIDPPQALHEHVAACRNVRTWPVLAGETSQRSTMLSSPIILYDYPEIAPESAGDLFDSTEIDEILSLRILTLTDDEQREMCQADERARLVLERTRSLAADEFLKMHGVMRRPG